ESLQPFERFPDSRNLRRLRTDREGSALVAVRDRALLSRQVLARSREDVPQIARCQPAGSILSPEQDGACPAQLEPFGRMPRKSLPEEKRVRDLRVRILERREKDAPAPLRPYPRDRERASRPSMDLPPRRRRPPQEE